MTREEFLKRMSQECEYPMGQAIADYIDSKLPPALPPANPKIDYDAEIEDLKAIIEKRNAEIEELKKKLKWEQDRLGGIREICKVPDLQ